MLTTGGEYEQDGFVGGLGQPINSDLDGDIDPNLAADLEEECFLGLVAESHDLRTIGEVGYAPTFDQPMWLEVWPNDRKPESGNYVGSIPVYNPFWGHRGNLIVFVNIGEDAPVLKMRQQVFLQLEVIIDRVTNRPQLDRNNNAMYNGRPVEGPIELNDLWYTKDGGRTFQRRRTTVDWMGNVIGVDGEVLEEQSREREETGPIENQYLDVDWDSMEMVIRNTGSRTTYGFRRSSNYRDAFVATQTTVEGIVLSTERAPITELRFEEDKWPFDDLFPLDSLSMMINLILPGVERPRLFNWSRISQEARDMIRDVYLICECGTTRYWRHGKQHCRKKRKPASEESLRRLQERFRGGA